MPEVQPRRSLAAVKVQVIQRNARIGVAREALENCACYFVVGGKLRLRRGKASPVEWLKPSILAGDPAFIEINTDCYRVLHVESDAHPATDDDYCAGLDPDFYLQHSLPIPNAVCQTRRGFHAFWFLRHPVSHHSKATQYFSDVRARIVQALGCDQACNTKGTVRSPFHSGQEHVARWWHYGACDLGDLDVFEHGPQVFAPIPTSEADRFEVGNRNRALFRHGLRLFRASRGGIDLDQLLAQLAAWQAQQSAPGVNRAELVAICRSVLRNGPRYGNAGHRAHRPGLLGLARPNWAGMTPSERQDEIRRRQSLGGLFTSSARKRGTLERLSEVAQSIPAGELTPRRLHEASGVPLRTCQRHFSSVSAGARCPDHPAPNAHRGTVFDGVEKAEGFPAPKGLSPRRGESSSFSSPKGRRLTHFSAGAPPGDRLRRPYGSSEFPRMLRDDLG